MRRFDGKVVLISGTGGGMGREAALAFAAEGAWVFGCDVKADGNAETAQMVSDQGGRMTATQPVDLSDPTEATKWVDAAAAQAGQIDVLFNNASACRFAPFESFTFEDWRWSIRNELDLVFTATRAAWPYLMRNGGVVLNTASVAGLAGSEPGGAAHAASKGAVIALTRQLAVEGAPHGIRALSISPGAVKTPGTAAMFEDPAFAAAMLARNLIKDVGVPSDIVAMALMLASDACRYMTGTDVVIDGGRTT